MRTHIRLLQFIFLVFTVLGPGLLVFSMLVTALVPMTPDMQYWALLVTQLLTSFSAWEVPIHPQFLLCICFWSLNLNQIQNSFKAYLNTENFFFNTNISPSRYSVRHSS